MKAWCMKCKDKKEMLDTDDITMKNGNKATKGRCECGTKLYRIGGKKDDTKIEREEI